MILGKPQKKALKILIPQLPTNILFQELLFLTNITATGCESILAELHCLEAEVGPCY